MTSESLANGSGDRVPAAAGAKSCSCRFPIEGQPDSFIFVAERLSPGRAQVDDGQAPVAEQDAPVIEGLHTASIRTALRKGVQHPPELIGR